VVPRTPAASRTRAGRSPTRARTIRRSWNPSGSARALARR
jgi:hypothetical protein